VSSTVSAPPTPGLSTGPGTPRTTVVARLRGVLVVPEVRWAGLATVLFAAADD